MPRTLAPGSRLPSRPARAVESASVVVCCDPASAAPLRCPCGTAKTPRRVRLHDSRLPQVYGVRASARGVAGLPARSSVAPSSRVLFRFTLTVLVFRRNASQAPHVLIQDETNTMLITLECTAPPRSLDAGPA